MPSSDLSAVVLPSLASTLGAAYLGSSVALVLYGITNLQTFIYYKRYPGDWWFYKYSVVVLWVFDTLHVVLSMHALYFYLIESFGNYLALVKIVWSSKLIVLVNVRTIIFFPAKNVPDYEQSLVVVDVHIVYSVRLWLLGRHFHHVVPWLIISIFTYSDSRFTHIKVLKVFVVLTSCVAAILLSFDMYTISNFGQLPDISRTIDGALATAAAVDMIIALSLCYYLLKIRVTTVFSRHDLIFL
ncbi:hypothetical protein IW261DRAFT_1572276 [Armillaria novae-zelandiae]|uniref:Uncharacterized protein n=1 Tax=Armillaria novae-zelandiae TaxID=153914 RepID=A0AA39NSW2_9AGAR|nr:hypothetical protein IW261DRAFT_1572276 [Armillaria novae-zelandiae]